MNSIVASGNFAASSPSAREMMIVAFRHKWLLTLAFAIPLLIALSLAFTAQTLYQADAKLVVRAGREYVAALETGERGAIPPSGTMQEAIDTEVEILTSKDVLGDVVDALGAGYLYPAPPDEKPSFLASLSHRAPSDPVDPARAKETARNTAIKALSEDLRVKPVKLSNVIELSVRNPDRAVAIETLSRLLIAFRARHIAAFNRQRGSALEEQANRYMAEIAGLEKDRAEYGAANRLFAAGEQRTVLIQQRARLAQEAQDAGIRRVTLEEQVRYLAAKIRELPQTVKLETQTQPSPATEDTDKALQALRAKEGLYIQHFRPGSAMLRDLRAQIAAHEHVLSRGRTVSAVRTGVNPILTGLETQLLAARTELAPLAIKETDLNAAMTGMDERLREIGKAELHLMGLDRRIGQLNAASTTLHQRLQDSRFLDDLDRLHLTSVNVIESPAAAEKPVAPRKMLFGLAGVICGLVAMAGAFLMALTFRNRFLSVEMTERVLGIPVVAAMPLTLPPTRRALAAARMGDAASPPASSIRAASTPVLAGRAWFARETA